MAFSTKKLGANDVNGGNEFTNGQGLTPNDINSIVKGVLWLNENGGSGSGGSGGGSTIYKHTFEIEENHDPSTFGIANGFFYSTNPNPNQVSIQDGTIIVGAPATSGSLGAYETTIISNPIIVYNDVFNLMDFNNSYGYFEFDLANATNVEEDVEGV